MKILFIIIIIIILLYYYLLHIIIWLYVLMMWWWWWEEKIHDIHRVTPPTLASPHPPTIPFTTFSVANTWKSACTLVYRCRAYPRGRTSVPGKWMHGNRRLRCQDICSGGRCNCLWIRKCLGCCTAMRIFQCYHRQRLCS